MSHVSTFDVLVYVCSHQAIAEQKSATQINQGSLASCRVDGIQLAGGHVDSNEGAVFIGL